jgi:hemoglobin
MKNDIINRNDIILLINTFYEKVKQDQVIGYIFNDVAKVNWEKHLPVMYDFWENVIFFTGNYNGNPMMVHKHLNNKTALNTDHFKEWIKLFTQTVDELFEGEKAELTKQRAMSIATAMQIKIIHENESIPG